MFYCFTASRIRYTHRHTQTRTDTHKQSHTHAHTHFCLFVCCLFYCFTASRSSSSKVHTHICLCVCLCCCFTALADNPSLATSLHCSYSVLELQFVLQGLCLWAWFRMFRSRVIRVFPARLCRPHVFCSWRYSMSCENALASLVFLSRCVLLRLAVLPDVHGPCALAGFPHALRARGLWRLVRGPQGPRPRQRPQERRRWWRQVEPRQGRHTSELPYSVFVCLFASPHTLTVRLRLKQYAAPAYFVAQCHPCVCGLDKRCLVFYLRSSPHSVASALF